MTLPSQRLDELGITLPPMPAPVAAYVPAVRSGDLVFTAGQLPFVDGALPATGLVGGAVSAEEAQGLAGVAALNAIAVVAQAAGGVDNVARIVKVTCFVASEAGFTGQPFVANGASELLAEIFGEAGRHARSAVGASALPLGAPVEVELVAQVR